MLEPGGVLGRILENKREELASRFETVSLDSLRQHAQRTVRSLSGAIANTGARFILEIKKASPSQGAIRSSADPIALAQGYAGVADALSVLCDTVHFGGSLEDLRAARTSFEGPILAKDFFIDRRQVAEARIAGADAVLVMLSLLEDSEARAMIDEAHLLGMDALVEVHDELEMQRALALNAPLIGINNRNLKDLEVDLETTERLAKLAPDRLLVSESGINDRADVDRLAPLVDGFLVGTSLMRAAAPAQAARQLIFGRTKLCGFNREADLRAARPAAFAGLVFASQSPRKVEPKEAVVLAATVRSSGMLPVGVFRDAPLESVANHVRSLGLHAVQLHGFENTEYVRELRRQLPDECEIWTARSVGRDSLEEGGGDRLLFDNGEGGSGRMFDWSLIAKHPQLSSAILAGGIGVHNAREALKLGAYAIDVGSSVDEVPGKKSPQKISALFDVLRPDSRGRLAECA